MMEAEGSIKERLNAALSADCSDSLLQLCQELDTNLTLTVGGYTDGEVEQSVTHHIAFKAQSVQCLRALIQRLGPPCLTCRNAYNNTPVHIAAQKQDDSWMKLIHECLGSDCFLVEGQFHRTVIHFGAMNTFSDSALKFLIEACGRDSLSLVDEHGNTPVHLAAKFQGADSMQLMKEQLGLDCFHQRGLWRRTAIHWAATNPLSNSALKFLIDECGRDSLTAVDEFGNTPVHLAAWKQSSDSMILMKSELGLDCFHWRGQFQRTVTHCAAMNSCDNSSFKWLVREFGTACLTVTDEHNDTPVHLAAWQQTDDSLELVADLIGKQVCLIEGFNGWTVAHQAARNTSSSSVLHWCIRNLGSSCLLVKDSNGATPVHLAAQHQDLDCLQLIHGSLDSSAFRLKDYEGRAVDAYARMNKKHGVQILEWLEELLHFKDRLVAALKAGDDDSLLQLCSKLNTNLTLTVGGYKGGKIEQSVTHHVACKARNVECLKELIQRLGAQCLTCTNSAKQTPVHCAAVNQDDSWIKLIFKILGSDCFLERDKHQRTAIHCAASNRVSNSALKWLVKHFGKDCLTLADEFGNTPVHLAACFQSADTMRLMKTQLGLDCFNQRGQCLRNAVHFAATNTASNSAFKWLVKECGIRCLTVTDGQCNTPVHLAAWQQTEDSLQFVANLIGTEVFFLKGFCSDSVAHSAAQNNRKSSLLWCIENLGSSCLLDRDSDGRTPAHLAAKQHGLDLLRLIYDCLGRWAFELRDSTGNNLVDYVKMNETQGSRMLEWLEEQRALEDFRSNFSAWKIFHNSNGQLHALRSSQFGKTYKAVTDRHQTVAVEIVQGLSLEQLKIPSIDQEMKSLELLKHIGHPNIAQFLKTETNSKHGFCIFTELVEGNTLSEKMNKLNKPFDELSVKRFSMQICAALHFLHCEQRPPIVHRNVKCENILLTNKGLIKLIDFGFAREIALASMSQRARTTGAAHFMAAELLNGSDRVAAAFTPKTDVWAFGCTLLEMLTMKPPYGDLQPAQIVENIATKGAPKLPAGVSDGLRDFYRRCVAKRPWQRADTKELLRHSFLHSRDPSWLVTRLPGFFRSVIAELAEIRVETSQHEKVEFSFEHRFKA